MPPNLLEELRIDVDGVDTFYRRVPGEGPPTVFVHGNPTHSEDWMPFLREIEGPAIAPDLPGWGRSERPAGFDYSMHGLAAFFERFLDAVAVEEHSLVAHDWGVLSLIAEQRHPARLRRLVLFNCVPLMSGFRWHWVGRIWRRRPFGELLNLSGSRAATARILRQVRADRGPMPDEFVEMIWSQYRRGVGRPVLELYRSADPDVLAAAGRDLGRIRSPALVVWGEADPYIDADFGRRFAQALPNAELDVLPDAGHWPWIERPDTIGRILNFLASS